MPRLRSRSRRLAAWLLALAGAWWGAGLVAAWIVVSPHPASIPGRARLGGLPLETLTFEAADGVRLEAWYARVEGERAVILGAGIRGDRLANVTRAELYLARGYSVLLPDLRGTGASEPSRISLGWHEARDLLACRGVLADRGYAHIGVHGQSLGAAAACYAHAELDPTFLVLEAPYRDARSALHNRLPFVPWPRLMLWPLEVCTEWLADIDAAELCPERTLADYRGPLLVLTGANDRKARPAEVRAVAEAPPGSDAQLVILDGAAHVDLLAHSPESFEAALDAFLGELP